MQGKTVLITGAAGGIGAAVARRFAREGANVALSDLKAPVELADELGGRAWACDVSSEAALCAFIDAAGGAFGAVDTFVANAGVGYGDPTHAGSAADARWEASWRINVMQSVWAARALLPLWMERGSGRLVVVASAAGLLTQIGSASYSATKAAAVSFAESVAIAHAHDGVRVQCVCPQYVRTGMTARMNLPEDGPLAPVAPDVVADSLMDAIAEERFLVLPHPIVADYTRNKADDPDRWIKAMTQLRDEMMGRAALPSEVTT